MTQIRWRTLMAGVVLAGAVAGLVGCAGYKLGSTLPPDLKTIFVPTFVNKTSEPQLEFTTTQAALREFQLDGSLKVTTRENADSTIEVTLTKYALAPIRYNRDQATQVQEYRLTLTASVVFKRLPSGKVVMASDEVTGEATFTLSGDIASAKRTALPEAAKDLGHNIVKSVVESW